MFQSFEIAPDPAIGVGRTQRLRVLMRQAGLDAFLVPRADEHQGEYVPPSAERLGWLTGFTGSAGSAIVTAAKAALFVDGRYTLQAPAQVDTKLYEIVEIPAGWHGDWLIEHLKAGAVVGFDPWLHTAAEIERLTAALKPKGIRVKAVARNPVDRAWGAQRPAPPSGAVSAHSLKYAGVAAEDKIARLQRLLSERGENACVLTLPDSICWLFNIRGTDVAHNPVVLAFAIVPARGKPELFIAPVKLDADVKAHLTKVCRLAALDAFAERLRTLKRDGKKVRLDPETAAFEIARALGGSKKCAAGADPCIATKAVKNPVEIEGARAAQSRDGIAVVQFLSWLDREASKGGVDEIAAAKRLEAARAATGELRDVAFDTIAGSGPNGAIVHYRVNDATNRRLKSGELFLVDSGGQYADGTTDVTRTIAIGKPTPEMRQRYTLVLKGHIAIATARFPKGTRGIELDPLARRALWDYGLDYDHGTGHGVGSFLSVHEGPQSISRRGMAVLEPGMLCSNEPGCYKPGAYGIRLENLVLVTPLAPVPGGDREMMGFETITLVPFDRRLITVELLAPSERDWLNAYHARVAELIAPGLDAVDAAWLARATAPI